MSGLQSPWNACCRTRASDSRIVDVARERDRLGGERLPPRAVVLVEQLLRLQREQLGAPAGVGPVVELERAFDRLDPLVVEVADQAREPAGVGESRGGGQIGIAERRRDPRRVQQRRAIRRVAGQLLRLAEADQRPAAFGVLDRAEQLERVGEQLRRLRRREAVEREPPGAAPSSALPSSLSIAASRQCSASSATWSAGSCPYSVLERDRDAVVHARRAVSHRAPRTRSG